MKRTNLMLNAQLLEEAKKLSGERTYSATVNLALRELVRRITAGQILQFAGSGVWEGNLSEMRGDRVEGQTHSAVVRERPRKPRGSR